MDWVTSIHQAIQYIEEHLREELTIREIAQQAALSPFYFQKGFAMLCGMTVGDYIRQRRLSAAGLEVLTTDRRIIDIALEFGYDSPDSFTKAFTRFHGLTPAALRKSGGAVRSFAPLRIKVTLEGGELITARCPEPGTCVWLDQNRLCWPLSSGAPDSGAFMPRCS